MLCLITNHPVMRIYVLFKIGISYQEKEVTCKKIAIDI